MKGLHTCAARNCIRTENTAYCGGCDAWLCLTHRHVEGSEACRAQKAWTIGSAALNHPGAADYIERRIVEKDVLEDPEAIDGKTIPKDDWRRKWK